MSVTARLRPPVGHGRTRVAGGRSGRAVRAGSTPPRRRSSSLAALRPARCCSCCRCRAPTGRCSAATRARTSRRTTTKAVEQPVLRRTRCVFTLKYTVLATVLLHRPGPRARAAGAGVDAAGRGSCAPSFLVPERPRTGLGLAALLRALLAARRPVRRRCMKPHRAVTFLGTPDAALWSTLFLIVWRYAGFYMLLMLVGPAGHPDRRLRGGPHRRRLALADLPRHHAPAAAPDPRPDARCSASPARCSRSSSSTS